jgi:hypothetical protein
MNVKDKIKRLEKKLKIENQEGDFERFYQSVLSVFSLCNADSKQIDRDELKKIKPTDRNEYICNILRTYVTP